MSGRIKRAEEFVYSAVRSGELEILPNGTIWRVAARRDDRWNGGTRIIPCQRRVADRFIGEGYRQVRAMVDWKRMTALSHRLIWFHLHGKIPDGLTVNHKNGIKHDNRPDNLELATDSEQQLHALHVLHRGRAVNQDGERNHAAKLTKLQVQEIRTLRQQGVSLLELAAKYGISFQHVSAIARMKARLVG